MNADEVVRGLREWNECHLSDMCIETDSQCWKFCNNGDCIAVQAADLIESLQSQLADYHHMSELVDGKMEENQRLRRINENLQEQLAASQRRVQDARNELCLKCGRYCDAHKGACDGCRWMA